MRDTVKAIVAGGPSAIIAVGAGGWVLRSELHYLLRPSVVETVAAGAAVVAAAVWMRKRGQRKPSIDKQVQELAQALQEQAARQELPQAQPHVGQVIDYTSSARRQV